ncbi:MAG: hypothetical protein WB919_05975 [Candidatus Sulfotelmatobacter sp.]
MNRTYEVTPDEIGYRALFPNRHYCEQILLLELKSTHLQEVGHPGGASPAETGIFNVKTQDHKGFQYGNPQVRPDILQLDLYSEDGSFQVKVLQGSYDEPGGVTQPEINRIAQSLHKMASSPVAQR